MHIKKANDANGFLGEFVSWCGVKVDGFTPSYLSVDNALKAMTARAGAYPCQKCLREIGEIVNSGLTNAAAKE